MKNPLVSVILPVYGVEKYLNKAVDSVMAQTYKNFELILVDDCSPDSCPLLCDNAAEKYPEIRVIHKQKNEGLGFARNTGLEEAVGEYVYFMDSDDYIEPDLLEKAVSALEENTEVVIFGVNRIHEDENGSITKTEKLTPDEAQCTSAKETADIFYMLNERKIFPFAWNKLYKKAFLDEIGIKFESTKLIEDFLFNIEIFGKAGFIRVIPENLYNYRKPAHETLVSAYSPDFFGLCKRKYGLEKEYLRLVNAETDRNLQLIYFSYVKHIFAVFIKNRSPKAGLSEKEQKKKISEVLADPVTKQVLSDYRPQGIVMKSVTAVLKKNNPLVCSVLNSATKIILNR